METGDRAGPGVPIRGDDGPEHSASRHLLPISAILVSTVFAGLALPAAAFTCGAALCFVIVLTGLGLAALRTWPYGAGLASALPCAAYLAAVFSGFRDGPMPLVVQAGILLSFWAMGMAGILALAGMAHRNQEAICHLNRTIRRSKADEAEREKDFIRMNNSLALEIRAHTEAETRLRESEEKYRHLVDSLPEGVVIVQDGKIIFFNPGFERLCGRGADTLTGADPEQLFNCSAQAAGASRDHFYLVMPDRSKRFVDTQWVDIQFNSAQARLYTVRDITERVRAAREKEQLEAKLEKAKKMEALGLMAAGVAHDLNNVLSGIVSTPDLLLMELPEDSAIRETVMSIKDAGKRASVIVDELLTLGRGRPEILSPVHLNGAIQDYLISPEFETACRFHPGIRVDTLLDNGVSVISGSAILIRKIVMNLVTNAMEAIQDRGRITLSTRNIRFDQERLKGYERYLEGEYIRLRVSDTGPGIPEQDLERIFEPFYTKKILGRSGTGLGLSIVWNIVHDLKGFIQVESDDSGSCFDLYFPVATGLQDTLEPDKIYTLNDYAGNGQHVLVVDDEKSQLKITANMLSRMGYRTAAVSSGKAALDYVRANPVDLVVLDMIMAPGMDGLQTFQRLRAMDPGIRSVLASGYAETDDVLTAQGLGAGPFIKKPFSLRTLGLAVKKELERIENDH